MEVVFRTISVLIFLVSPSFCIYKGIPAGKHEFPYQVAILLVNEGPDEPILCNGAILNKNWIISTASCLTSHDKENLNAVAGVHYISAWTNHEHRRELTKVVAYPDFDQEAKPNALYDVAVGQLNEPFVFGEHVKAVSLPEKNTYPSGKSWVAGWGGTSIIYMRPNDLMKAEVRISPKNGCIESAAGPMFCATHSNTSPICKWDDGAPLVQEHEGNFVLIGVATIPFIPKNTNKCPSSTQSSKFAMVSQLKDWIEKTIE